MSDSKINMMSGWSPDSPLATIVSRETKDFPDVLAHETRVAGVSEKIGTIIGMDAAEIAILSFAARLHDVGKMLIPTSILRKPGRLDAEERAIVETHAKKGAEMLACVPGMSQDAIDVAMHHHERYDGFGYHGLSGEDIPFKARIVAIADVYDALSAKRDYKDAMLEGQVLSLMTADAASGRVLGRRAFDPVLLRFFVQSRLMDADADIGNQYRDDLEAYAYSAPESDLSEDLACRVSFSGNGDRTILDEFRREVVSLNLAGVPVDRLQLERSIA